MQGDRQTSWQIIRLSFEPEPALVFCLNLRICCYLLPERRAGEAEAETYLCSAEIPVCLPANKWIWLLGSFGETAFLLSWETIRSNQLWQRAFFINLIPELSRAELRAVPPLRSHPIPFPKTHQEYWFCGVIIIAFINRGCKTEQSPYKSFHLKDVCVCGGGINKYNIINTNS